MPGPVLGPHYSPPGTEGNTMKGLGGHFSGFWFRDVRTHGGFPNEGYLSRIPANRIIILWGPYLGSHLKCRVLPNISA